MIFISITILSILALTMIRLRIVHSATFIHVVHFRTKLLHMANNDPYWYGVYDNLPTLKKHVFCSSFGDMRRYMDDEAQERYIFEGLPHHAIKRSKKKVEEIKFEV